MQSTLPQSHGRHGGAGQLQPTSRRRSRKRSHSSRAFFMTLLCVSIIVAVAMIRDATGSKSLRGGNLQQRQLSTFSKDNLAGDCHLVHDDRITDKCAFVRAHCPDEEAGLISYLDLYFCKMHKVKPIAFILIILWLATLFLTIGIAASDFFVVNLSTVAKLLDIGDALAGVTLVALGNGSPDVFSTFAAMGSNSGSLAVGELIGAAGFITTVVAGAVALAKPFELKPGYKKLFMRDVAFFMVAASFSLVFLKDGQLHLWECGVMVGFYIFYVGFVAVWHWRDHQRNKQLKREQEIRSHFVTERGDEAQVQGAYHDEETSQRRTSTTRAPSEADLNALERGDASGEAEQEQVTELHKKMSLFGWSNRPRGNSSSRHSMHIVVGQNDIRLNERSTDESLRPEIQNRPRAKSELIVNRYNMDSSPQGESNPVGPDFLQVPSPGLDPPSPASSGTSRPPIQTPRSAHLTVPGGLSVPMGNQHTPRSLSSTNSLGYSQHNIESASLKLAIPERLPPSRISPINSPFPIHEEDSNSYFSDEPPRNIPTQWPWRIMTSLSSFMPTLFPSFYGWHKKTYWKKLTGIVSIPSVFLLTITLPVVNSDKEDDDDEEEEEDQANKSPVIKQKPQSSSASLVATNDTNGSLNQQPYRDDPSETQIEANPANNEESHVVQSAHNPNHIATIPSSSVQDIVSSHTPLAVEDPEESPLWNRWLVIIQIFTAPLFVVLLLWLNNPESSSKALVKPTLISLLCSLVALFALLRTTDSDRAPKWHSALCFLGFIVAIGWISTIANEVVGVLKWLGVVLDISDAILGLTIFAMGNSVGDLATNWSLATDTEPKPQMALTACFGGPMLNILLGIGVSGGWMTIKGARHHQKEHPGSDLKFKPYSLEISSTLLISGATLLFTLLALLIGIPWKKWMMDRKVGWSLIGLWCFTTAVNVFAEVMGWHRDIR